MEPPGRSPFSRTRTFAPSSRARAAATSPAIPAPATSRSNLDQREARLVLHVLDLDPVGAPDEDRVRVGRVDDVGDLDPLSLRFLDVIVRGVDLESEVVE